ncbi:MAG: hypothetical protein GYB64_08280 [Chloroflexi bacterium]|nr:hypothetical protein [Chloroflexota bacterium]
MAQDQFDLLMSLALDDQLDADEQALLRTQIAESAEFSRAWDRMQTIDGMLSNQREVAPAVDFTAQVMARIEAYEERLQWTPWLSALIGGTIVATLVSFLTPWLLLTGLLQPVLARVPVLGVLLAQVMQIFDTATFLATLFVRVVTNWVTFIVTDPTALGVIVGALVVASTWIGLREAYKLTASLEASTSTP